MEETILEDVRMQHFQKIAITVAFSFTCFSVPVLGAQSGANTVISEKAAVDAKQPVVPLPGTKAPGSGSGATAVGGRDQGSAVQPARPGTGVEGETQPVGTGVESGLIGGGAVETPLKPDWTAGSLAEQVKALQAQFKREQQDLMKVYQEMLRKAKEAGKEERDKVREQFKVQRDDLLSRQKELRDEIKRRFEEFRTGHPEHQEIIDAARERAKESVRERRGHGGE